MIFFFFIPSFVVLSALTLILRAAPRQDSFPYDGLRHLVRVQNKSAIQAPTALLETAPFRMSERDHAFIQAFRQKKCEEKKERRVYRDEVGKMLSAAAQERKSATRKEVDRMRQRLKSDEHR